LKCTCFISLRNLEMPTIFRNMVSLSVIVCSFCCFKSIQQAYLSLYLITTDFTPQKIKFVKYLFLYKKRGYQELVHTCTPSY
jgi:Golgi nucleoside diphosphatase